MMAEQQHLLDLDTWELGQLLTHVAGRALVYQQHNALDRLFESEKAEMARWNNLFEKLDALSGGGR